MQKFLKELFESFIRKEGREPDNLEMIILKQKAAAKDFESRKIISMFNKEPVDANKPIIGGTNIKETDEGNYRAEVVSQCEHDAEKY